MPLKAIMWYFQGLGSQFYCNIEIIHYYLNKKLNKLQTRGKSRLKTENQKAEIHMITNHAALCLLRGKYYIIIVQYYGFLTTVVVFQGMN